MRSPGLARAAAALLGAEAIALLVIALVELFGLSSGDVTVATTGIALVALTAIGAVGLGVFAVGVLRNVSWARSGGVVLQVLGVAIAAASLTVPPISWLTVFAVGIPCLLGAALLLAGASAEGKPTQKARRR